MTNTKLFKQHNQLSEKKTKATSERLEHREKNQTQAFCAGKTSRHKDKVGYGNIRTHAKQFQSCLSYHNFCIDMAAYEFRELKKFVTNVFNRVGNNFYNSSGDDQEVSPGD